ncbi:MULTISPECIES: putative DNA-binding protein [Carnobacterium]|uniref:UPF0122 protein ACFSBK_06330 n=1 Tax=Carnobacterium antarcticum TaxID=2126436 RepID=A0ABW4NNX9_9LACT|nr:MULTISPECIES: putative DNA-binding protein [unclassified Carnobacterium]ALV20960.1 Signal recognition particle associated protein [Carnobacterium sp. CP1]QQP71114.1 putative DNA-binding protein [Carnobacterium sp. CS13]
MEIERTNRMNALFDFYGSLLTEKQRSYMLLYFADDYSLGEIAEDFDVSRQAIYDNIRRTEQILMEYERKLHLLDNFNQSEKTINELSLYIKDHYPKDETLQGFVRRLKKDTDDE